MIPSLRRHWPFLLLFPLLILAMTYPSVARLFDSEGFWLVQNDIDARMLLWDAWYFERLITGRADFYFTDLLFHPTGVSLAFHNFSLPHMALLSALKLFLPAAKALNLAYLILTFLNAAAGYVYLHYLFRDRWVALFGTVVFGASAFIIARPAHTNIAFIATIPLSLYWLHRGLLEERLAFMLMAGLTIGITAFIGMYSLVCLLMMLGAYLLYFAKDRWRRRGFWLHVSLMLLIVLAFAALRFAPMLSDPAGLSSALAKRGSKEAGTDLLGYFVNYRHPVTGPALARLFPLEVIDRGWPSVVFLGYVPLLLIVLAIARADARRRLLPWLLLALPFLTLRLGSYLSINGQLYTEIALPKRFLAEALPQLFQPFWATDNFHAGTLLPFAAMSCVGLLALLKWLPSRRRSLLVLLLTGLVAWEYYQALEPYTMPEGRLDFIDWLKSEEDQADIHLINLPTGKQNSKIYSFHQTYTGYPHVEGRPTRTPIAAYAYMDQNLLLASWRAGDALRCGLDNRAAYLAARGQLLDDGFTHVLVHRDRLKDEQVAQSFVDVAAAYRDRFVSIYRVADLEQSCAIATAFQQAALPALDAAPSHALLAKQSAATLSLHPYVAVINDQPRQASAILVNGGDYVLLNASELAEQSAIAARDAKDIILLAYDPGAATADLVAAYRAWLEGPFASCGTVPGADPLSAELFLRRGFPCELALSESPFRVDYDNGVKLGNLLADLRGDQLELALLWESLPAEPHAMSAQIFDSAGQKAHGQDFVFHRDALQQETIDLSSLPPGQYQLKLIAYNYESGVSLPGTLISREEHFARELDVMTLTLD